MAQLDLSVRFDRPFLEIKQYLVDELERVYLTRCLEDAAMNISLASRASGLSRKHIRTLMSKHGIVVRRALGTDSDVNDVNE